MPLTFGLFPFKLTGGGRQQSRESCPLNITEHAGSCCVLHPGRCCPVWMGNPWVVTVVTVYDIGTDPWCILKEKKEGQGEQICIKLTPDCHKKYPSYYIRTSLRNIFSQTRWQIVLINYPSGCSVTWSCRSTMMGLCWGRWAAGWSMRGGVLVWLYCLDSSKGTCWWCWEKSKWWKFSSWTRELSSTGLSRLPQWCLSGGLWRDAEKSHDCNTVCLTPCASKQIPHVTHTLFGWQIIQICFLNQRFKRECTISDHECSLSTTELRPWASILIQ